MPGEANETPNLLSPEEVAQLFRVDPKTVTRWAKAGKLSPVKTLGAIGDITPMKSMSC